ncbi:dolichyl-phosphate-mannose-protein mannosyltransferase [Micromonospora palomenae]|uniref:Dolichyl-phosphate-mannose-protein mannosyltransferase n=1 Tax=Micromonospora palomenae TaxID=1461247 RepID=A0A561WTE2_9ACTN|nr:glycosyltransferase family 39 protein [Micromonospora palomenae]TWG27162.1 dolichyl-phosphate-mannose-protein mannosyltransferase [Micromonospora palomenae]
MKDADTIVLPRLASTEVDVEDPWGEGHDVAPQPATHPVRWRVAAWLVPALLTVALCLVRAGAPVPPTEDAPTWGIAGSALMRWWAEFLGTPGPAVRAVSMVAITAAAALVGLLAARLFTPRVGLLAGVIFALLPTSTRYAQEVQPYALTVFAAVLATFLLVLAVDRPTFGRFAGYGAAVLLLGLSHGLALLLLAGHGWTVFAFRRGVAGRWSAVALLGALPAAAALGLFGGQPGAPIAGSKLTPDVLAATPRELFGVTALGIVLLGLALFSLPLRRSAAVYTAWAVVPPLGLLLVAQATPIWLPEVLLFTLPAWATLGAVALARVRARWCAVALVAIAVLGAPAQLARPAPEGREQATGDLARIIQLWTRPAGGETPHGARPAPAGE